MRVNIIVFVILYVFSINIYAEIKHKDEIKALVNSDLILNSELETHLSSLTMLINIKTTTDLKDQALIDLISTKLQTKLSHKHNITAQNDEIKNVYTQFIQRNKLSADEYYELLQSYNLTHDELSVFIKENIIVEKLHEKLLHQHLTATRDELNSMLELSNNCLFESQSSAYKILKISFNRSQNKKIDLIAIRNVISFLKSNHDGLMIYNDKEPLNLTMKMFVLPISEDTENRSREFIEDNLERKILGPFYTKNRIEFLKIIEKRSIIKESDRDIKIKYFTFKRNLKKLHNNVDKFKSRKHKLNSIRKLMRKYDESVLFDIKWLGETNIPKKLYPKIKKLNDNEISENLETTDGWYVVQRLYREYKKDTDSYKKLESYLKNHKLKKIRKNWIKNLHKDAYIKFYG